MVFNAAACRSMMWAQYASIAIPAV